MARAFKPEVPSVSNYRTAEQAADLIEEYVRASSIPGLGRYGSAAEKRQRLDEQFAQYRDLAKEGAFHAYHFEYEHAFGISASIRVDFDSTYETERGIFGGYQNPKERKFLSWTAKVSVNCPSMNKTVEQTVAFVSLLSDVTKLASYLSVALNDQRLVQFVDVKEEK